jgi:hypothetical protein
MVLICLQARILESLVISAMPSAKSGRADEPVAGIGGIIRGQLVGQNGNLCRDWPDRGSRNNLFDESLHGASYVGVDREWGARLTPIT